jgi:hypothetical protein
MPETREAIIQKLERIRPFVIGTDPYNHGRNDAINQAIQIVITAMTEEER